MKRGDGDYTVGKLAALAGVSVRTLRLYDERGIVMPSGRTSAGYRLYGDADLLRLQQALFYRELGFSLDGIAKALNTPGYDNVAALKRHRRLLELKAARLATLMATIDRTVSDLMGEEAMLSDKDLYEGFDDETIERYEREAKDAWGGGKAYEQSRKRLRNMGKDEWAHIKARGEDIASAFADAFKAGVAADSAAALGLCARWVEHLRAFYEPSPEMVAGLGAMYADHAEFRAYYESKAPGLADWLKPAMAAYAESMSA